MNNVIELVCSNKPASAKHAVLALEDLDEPLYVAYDRDGYNLIGTLKMIQDAIEDLGYIVIHTTAGSEYIEVTAQEMYEPDRQDVWKLSIIHVAK